MGVSELKEKARQRQLPPPHVARAIRLRARITQAELAEALGVAQPTIAHWEAGRKKPSPAHAGEYAAALDAMGEIR